MADFVKSAFIQVHGVHGVPVDFMFIAISHSVAAGAGHVCICICKAGKLGRTRSPEIAQ